MFKYYQKKKNQAEPSKGHSFHPTGLAKVTLIRSNSQEPHGYCEGAAESCGSAGKYISCATMCLLDQCGLNGRAARRQKLGRERCHRKYMAQENKGIWSDKTKTELSDLHAKY